MATCIQTTYDITHQLYTELQVPKEVLLLMSTRIYPILDYAVQTYLLETLQYTYSLMSIYIMCLFKMTKLS